MISETEPLLGSWFVSGLNIVGNEDGILAMLPEGRAVQFPTSITRKREDLIMRLWYTRLDERSINFRKKPKAEGWVRFVEKTSEGWCLICDDDRGRYEFPCRPALPDELPDWYSDMLGKNLEMMVAREAE